MKYMKYAPKFLRIGSTYPTKINPIEKSPIPIRFPSDSPDLGHSPTLLQLRLQLPPLPGRWRANPLVPINV